MINLESFFMMFFFLVCICFFLFNRKKRIENDSLKKTVINKNEVKKVTLYAKSGDYDSSYGIAKIVENSNQVYKESFYSREVIEYLIMVCSEYGQEIKAENKKLHYVNSFNLFRNYTKYKNDSLDFFCNEIKEKPISFFLIKFSR